MTFLCFILLFHFVLHINIFTGHPGELGLKLARVYSNNREKEDWEKGLIIYLSSYESFKEQLLSGTSKFYSIIGQSTIRLLLPSEKQWNICRRLLSVLVWRKCTGLELFSIWVKFLRMLGSLSCGGLMPDVSFHSYTPNVWSWPLEKVANIIICSHCRVLGNNLVKLLLLSCVVYSITLYIVLFDIVLYSKFIVNTVVCWLFIF